jgi:predicted TIM-barrel fold metal-dependent hydrolase
VIVDADLHHQIADWGAVAPFAPVGLRHRVARRGGPPIARHGFAPVGVAAARGRATDPADVRAQYLTPRGVDRAILTGPILSLGVQPNDDMAATIATAVNDWTLETWVRSDDAFKGSILVAQQDPAQAVAEIDRLGDDPGMVQVLLSSASVMPLGNRHYHPIYEACARHGLPVAIHLGGEGAGTSPPASSAGHPSTYFEWYVDLPQSHMAHLVSMVTEGVFDRFPGLRVVLYEGGVFWLAPLTWRLDKNWKAQRSETPWTRDLPSQYIREHFYLTSYPLEAAPDPADLARMLRLIEAERTLLFSGNFPTWELGDPFEMVAAVPAAIRARVMGENAVDLYGPRLLAPSR